MLKSRRLFRICINRRKVIVQSFKKVILGRRSVNNSNQYWLGFRWKNFKENIFDFFRKVLFLGVAYITSDIEGNNSIVSVFVSTKKIIFVYLDFRLKNRFIMFKFGNSYNSCIARIGCICQFISLVRRLLIFRWIRWSPFGLKLFHSFWIQCLKIIFRPWI